MGLNTATRLTDVATGQSWVLRQNVFDQDKEWRQRDGSVIDIDMMELSHVANVIRFLERRMTQLHFAYIMDQDDFMHGPLGPGGDMATMAAEEAMDELTSMGPREWFEDTDLIKALRKRLAEGKPPVQRIKTGNPFERSRFSQRVRRR